MRNRESHGRIARPREALDRDGAGFVLTLRNTHRCCSRMQRHFRLRKLPEADRMTALAEPWRPYRTVGSWYMWRVLE